MAVQVSNEGALPIPLPEGEIADIVDAALAHCGVQRRCEVSVAIVDAEAMRGLNAAWRGIDAPTDVLSFECDSPWDEGIPSHEPVELGDVILAPEVIEAQAAEFGNTPAEEFRLMLVHGMLHLLGYDHMDEDEARAMEARELEVLRALAGRRGEDPDAVRIGPTTRHADD